VIVNKLVRSGLRRSVLAYLFLSCAVFAAIPGFANQSITLNWSASPSANVAGYNVYYGASSLDYTNMLVAGSAATNILIPGLVEGVTYYFAATAFDLTGVESDLSTEVAYWVPATNSSGPTFPPTISAIANQTVQKNSSLGPVSFVLADQDTPVGNLSVSAFSSYPLLVPVSNIVFGGAGADRTVQITPAPNRSGTATIGIIVTDDTGNSVVTQFLLTVLATTGSGGATPVVSALPDVTLAQNATGTNLSFVIQDADTPLAKVAVTVSSDNPLLFPLANLSILGSGSNRVLRVIPAINRSGTGHVIVSATDDLGHTGTSTNTVTVTPSWVPQSVVLLTSGSGTITPNLGTKSLTVGRKYTATAKPAAGNLFTGWSGDIVSTSASLNFTFEPNMVLQANFIPSPFIPASGSYVGLFSENAGVQVPSAGQLTATITRNGTYSGRVKLGGGSYPISGKMNLLCQATNRIKRGTSFLTIVMQTDQAGQIFGQVAQDSWTAPLQGFRAGYNATTNPAPQVGRYTMLMPGFPADATLPNGHSFATVTVSVGGLASLAGILADGTKVTQSAYLSRDGLWPYYMPLYGNKGLMMSWQTFRRQNDTDFDGWMVWVKPTNSAAKFYPAGFDYERGAFGQLYVPPVGTNVVFASTSYIQIPFSGGDLPAGFENAVHLEAGNKVINTSANSLSMKFTPATGIFTGTVTDPVLNKTWSFTAAVLQRDNVGYGFLSGTNESSQVQLIPH